MSPRSLNRLIILIGMAALMGCSSTQPGKSKSFADMIFGPTAEQRAQGYASACQSIGLKPGTEDYANCLLEQKEHEAERASKRTQLSCTPNYAGVVNCN